MCTDCGDDFHSWTEDQAALKNKREAARERKTLLRLEKKNSLTDGSWHGNEYLCYVHGHT